MEGMNAYQAAVKAGYSKNTALNAYRAVEEHCKFEDLFIKYGIDDDTIMRIMGEGLNAVKTVSAVITGKDAGAADHDFIDVPDFATRFKYLELLLKLNGKLREKIDINASLKVVEMRMIEIVRETEKKPLEFRIG
jgi:hypothetical protein